MKPEITPGPIALFGSGETSPSGRKIFEHVFSHMPSSPRVALLETPAGFELNSPQVAGKVATYIDHHLQNYTPQTEVIPARKRGTPYSPDDPKIAAPILNADLIFMGPGSPTYAVRQLKDSMVWNYVLARHRLGAALAMSSAATIALSANALPVYEIYKVGEDLHWKPGLDFFAPFGLSLTIIPHWNNNDGGEELDTSRCFVGRKRFEPLLEMLPPGRTVIGIDEHTGLLFDFAKKRCQVIGPGRIILIDAQGRKIMQESFSIEKLGSYQTPAPGEGLPIEAWEAAQREIRTPSPEAPDPPAEVLSLLDQRQEARQEGDWATADTLRDQIEALGWGVQDTPQGPKIVRK